MIFDISFPFHYHNQQNAAIRLGISHMGMVYWYLITPTRRKGVRFVGNNIGFPELGSELFLIIFFLQFFGFVVL